MKKTQAAIKTSRFPVSLLVVFFLVLLLMSGVHAGLIILANERNWNKLVQTIIPMIYWFLVALGLTLFTGWRIKGTMKSPCKIWHEQHQRLHTEIFQSMFRPRILRTN